MAAIPAAAQVGLKDVHYAILLTDDETGATYDPPVRIVGAIEATITPTVNTETLYADDAPSEVASAMGEIELELNVKDVPLDVQAALLGHTLNDEGVLIKDKDDQAPYIALGFKSLKSNGKYRYIWLLKGKFSIPEQSYMTKQDTPEFQTPTISGSFVVRESDGLWQYVGDEDATGFTPEIASAWFTSVYQPTPIP